MNNKAEENGGIILLLNKHTQEVLISDLYKESEREEKWNEWLSTAIERFKKSPQNDSNNIIQDFHIGSISYLENRTNKQISFLLQNLSPERELKILDAAFVMRKSKVLPNIDMIGKTIRLYKEEYEKYQINCTPLVSQVNATNSVIKDRGRMHPSNASQADERKASIPSKKSLEEEFESIDVIKTADGGGLIRVKKDGEYLPAQKLRKTDIDRMIKGSLKKEEVAELYFKDAEIKRMDRGGGIKR